MINATDIYMVTAYRFGDREKHSYVVGIYTDLAKAVVSCSDEENNRGGKYSCIIDQSVMNSPEIPNKIVYETILYKQHQEEIKDSIIQKINLRDYYKDEDLYLSLIEHAVNDVPFFTNTTYTPQAELKRKEVQEEIGRVLSTLKKITHLGQKNATK